MLRARGGYLGAPLFFEKTKKRANFVTLGGKPRLRNAFKSLGVVLHSDCGPGLITNGQEVESRASPLWSPFACSHN